MYKVNRNARGPIIRGVQKPMLALQGTFWSEWPPADEVVVWIIDIAGERDPCVPIFSQLRQWKSKWWLNKDARSELWPEQSSCRFHGFTRMVVPCTTAPAIARRK